MFDALTNAKDAIKVYCVVSKGTAMGTNEMAGAMAKMGS